MGKIYPEGLHGSFAYVPTNTSPVDNRTVVNSYNSLFQSDTWVVDGAVCTYHGMPVVVSEPSSQTVAIAETSGLYILLRSVAKLPTNERITGYEYIYDPDAIYSSDPDQNRFSYPVKDGDTVDEPGRSNLCGWLKIASMADLKFPTPETPSEYVLKVYPNGTFQWEQHTDTGGSIEPGDTAGMVLTTVEDEYGALTVEWREIEQQDVDLKIPQIANRYILRVDDPTDPTDGWHWEPEDDITSGIDIKNFATEYAPQDDPRPVVPSSGDLTRKRILSNSGEVIAVDEVPEDNTEEGPDRPFRLMLNYDAIPPLTIYGGNADQDPESGTLIVYYTFNDTEVKRTVASYQVGEESAFTPVASFEADGVTYIPNDTSTVYFTDDDTVHEITIPVSALPAWEPVLKYAFQRKEDIDSYDWTDSSAVVLTENNGMLPENARETPPSGKKYFYSPTGDLTVMQTDLLVCRLRAENAVLSAIHWWDGYNNSWKTIDASTDPSMTVITRPQPSGAYYYDLKASKTGIGIGQGVKLTYRFEVTKTSN